MILWSVSRAEAVNCTGELTVLPASGEHIFTVLLTVGVGQVDCAKETLHNKRKTRKTDTQRNDTSGPLEEMVETVTLMQLLASVLPVDPESYTPRSLISR